MKKGIKLIVIGVILLIAFGIYNKYKHDDVFYVFRPSINIETISCVNDLDKDGLNDQADIIEGAKKEVKNHTKYKSGYYAGGYPPQDEGVCTDVIWRALDNAGYILKDNMDKDIELNPDDYPRIDKIDTNIDFRRVKNQYVFMKKYMTNLPIEVIPYDKNNLTQWQGGDIVILSHPDHIAIISNKRRKDGIPYVIHNAYNYPKEEDRLLKWSDGNNIIGHFRFVNIEI
ncbi:DUF1287 domain-containing protein [Vallitalea guaymasensis]|uniref:DUF1287 domain-containing protein n=1 Tax=Vallitalea guaymasensis TaxID=1185412 RepID=UPI002355B5CF|nr:DUF1287 domain-containing protein [Vallitalea guaymasensis]